MSIGSNPAAVLYAGVQGGSSQPCRRWRVAGCRGWSAAQHISTNAVQLDQEAPSFRQHLYRHRGRVVLSGRYQGLLEQGDRRLPQEAGPGWSCLVSCRCLPATARGPGSPFRPGQPVLFPQRSEADGTLCGKGLPDQLMVSTIADRPHCRVLGLGFYSVVGMLYRGNTFDLWSDSRRLV